MRTVYLFLLITLSLQTLFSQANPDVDLSNFKQQFKTVEIQDWAGERFIFSRRPTSRQRFGYQSVQKMGDKFKSLPYADYVGRIVKVTGVRITDFSRDSYYVSLTVEDTGERLEGTANIGSIDGLVNFRDLERARSPTGNNTVAGYSLTSGNAQFSRVDFRQTRPIAAQESCRQFLYSPHTVPDANRRSTERIAAIQMVDPIYHFRLRGAQCARLGDCRRSNRSDEQHVCGSKIPT